MAPQGSSKKRAYFLEGSPYNPSILQQHNQGSLSQPFLPLFSILVIAKILVISSNEENKKETFEKLQFGIPFTDPGNKVM